MLLFPEGKNVILQKTAREPLSAPAYATGMQAIIEAHLQVEREQIQAAVSYYALTKQATNKPSVRFSASLVLGSATRSGTLCCDMAIGCLGKLDLAHAAPAQNMINK